RDAGAAAGAGIGATLQPVKHAAERVADVTEHNHSHGILATQPLQRHAGHVGSQYLLAQSVHNCALRIYHPGFGPECKPVPAEPDCGLSVSGSARDPRPSIRFMPKILSSSIVLLFSTMLIQPVQAALPAAVPAPALPTLAPVIEKVMPAIVNVHT